MPNKPICIDIYQGDDVQDTPVPLGGFQRVKAAGIFACIHKATEGTSFFDHRYSARRKVWMSGGGIPVMDIDGTPLSLNPKWGAYHFFHGSDSRGEANFFLKTADLEAGDEAFIDWEQVGASGFAPNAVAADEFCSEVEQKLGRSCSVYGGNVPREKLVGVSSALFDRMAARKLWFCAYVKIEAAELPGPWKKKGDWLRQDDGDRYGPGPHTIPGMNGFCDNSTVVTPMTVKKLYAEWGGGQLAA